MSTRLMHEDHCKLLKEADFNKNTCQIFAADSRLQAGAVELKQVFFAESDGRNDSEDNQVRTVDVSCEHRQVRFAGPGVEGVSLCQLVSRASRDHAAI